jgi:glycosyltransferase involved in cell wall biosynthesis
VLNQQQATTIGQRIGERLALPRLRVLCLPSWYPHPEDPTVAIFMQVQARALARWHDFVIVAPPSTVSLFSSPRNWVDQCEPMKNLEGLFEIHLRGTNYTPGLPGSYERVLWRLYRRGVLYATELWDKAPDVIHAHSVEAGYFGVKLAQKYHCPLVLTEHINHPSVLLRTLKDRQRFHYTMSKANIVIAVSSLQRDLLYQAGVRRRIEVIPNVIDTQFFSPFSGAQSAPPYRLIMVGNLIPRKGVQYLLEAVAELRRKGSLPVELDVIGKGELRGELESQSRSLGIESHVRFHGEKHQQDVRDLLRQSHIYVSPSITESFGVAIIEAMSVGLPVVVTRSGGPESYVSHNHGVVIEPGSSAELARGIREVISRFDSFDPKMQHEFVHRHFSERPVVEQITQQYCLSKQAMRSGEQFSH